MEQHRFWHLSSFLFFGFCHKSDERCVLPFEDSMNFDESASDEELMKAYQNGIEGAFDLLFKRHSARVYGFLLNRLPNRAAADDVFQNSFLKLHQARRHYDPDFPFVPWLFTVCKSVLIDFRRKQSRVLEVQDENALKNAPENATDAEIRGTQIEAPLLTGLSERERVAIELRYLEDLKFEEIAKRLQTSPANVRQLISRALKNLRGKTQRKGV